MTTIQQLRQRAVKDAKVFLSLYTWVDDEEWMTEAWQIARDERAPGTRSRNGKIIYFHTFRKYVQAHIGAVIGG